MDMIRRNYALSSFVVPAFCMVLAGAGCDQKPAAQVQPTAARPTPEKSFEDLARIAQDGIELSAGSSATGRVSQKTGASSRFQVYNTVTSEFIPPANANEVPRGTITVTTKSVYSLRQSAEDNDDEVVEQKGFNLMDEADGQDSGYKVMDEQLITETPANNKRGKEEIESVQRHADEDVRTYDFAYENNRWVLKSKLDPDTEKSIENAFERALRLQP
jgi:hypothetical protein